MAKRDDGLNQMMMLGIIAEPTRPEQRDDVGFFDGHEVRMVHVEGMTWWAATDVCSAMEIVNTPDAVTRLEEDERMTIATSDSHSGQGRGGAQSLLYVNEPGLYRLIFTSRKREAERFKHWVFHVVLPAIRKRGYYTTGPRHARIQRRLGCDAATAEGRIDISEVYISFCKALAAAGFKAPSHYGMATNKVYKATLGTYAKGGRKKVGARGRSPLFDHMSRLALGVQRLIFTLLEQEMRERAGAGGSVDVWDHLAYLQDRAGDVGEQLLAVVGPDRGFGVASDPNRGALWDVVQKQLESSN